MDDIYAYWCDSNNFGDALTPYLIRRLTGKNVVYTPPPSTKPTFMATGSMLDDDITNSIVWGCGIAWRNDNIKKALDLRAVRGPISRQRTLECGHPCPEVFGDPALLLPKLYMPTRKENVRIGIVPHYVDHGPVVDMYGTRADIKIIDITFPIEVVIDNIVNCDIIISSSLHGLITAQAYGKPNLWVEFSDCIIGDGTKFNDFYLSIGAAERKPVDCRKPLNIDELADSAVLCDMKLDLQKLINVCPFNDLKIL